MVDKNPVKTMSTKSSRINYGRISSQVPQAARTITIFLLLFTVCHVARVDSRVHVCTRTHTYTDNIQCTCVCMHCTQDFTARSSVVSCHTVSYDDSVHWTVYNIIIMLYRGNSHTNTTIARENGEKSIFLRKIATIVNIAYNISLAIT